MISRRYEDFGAFRFGSRNVLVNGGASKEYGKNFVWFCRHDTQLCDTRHVEDSKALLLAHDSGIVYSKPLQTSC